MNIHAFQWHLPDFASDPSQATAIWRLSQAPNPRVRSPGVFLQAPWTVKPAEEDDCKSSIPGVLSLRDNRGVLPGAM